MMTSRDPLHIVPSHLQRTAHDRCCHINVQEGQIRFAPDCTHEKRGTNVDLKEEWLRFAGQSSQPK